jgi:hypothetical protein
VFVCWPTLFLNAKIDTFLQEEQMCNLFTLLPEKNGFNLFFCGSGDPNQGLAQILSLS